MAFMVGGSVQKNGAPKTLSAAIKKAQDAYSFVAKDVKSSVIYLSDVWRLAGSRRAPEVLRAMAEVSTFLRGLEEQMKASESTTTDVAPDPDTTLLNKAMSALWSAHRAEAAYDEAIRESLSASAPFAELQRANIAAKVLSADLFARSEALKP